MSNINLNVVATGNFSNVLSEINKLRNKVTELNNDIAKVGGISDAQIASIKNAVSAYDSVIKSSGAFNRSVIDLKDNTEKFGRSLQDGKLKVGEYFNVWKQGQNSVTGSLRDLANQQVALQQSIIRSDPFKGGRVYVDTLRQVDELSNKTALVRKQQELYNLSLYKGGDALINWGKNTQWAGRQLTVGLTVPITLFGQKAAQAFLEFDKELTRVVKVYGSGLTAASDSTIQKIKSDVTKLSTQIAQQLGVPIQETAAIAADIAATGAEGQDLLNATNQAVRLSVLGEVDRQQAVKATISLQNVFKLNTNQLSESINFLNAVENQTSTSLQDIVEAIPKASPVVAQLGGSFKDVAVMMVAMKEAGVPAAESANAIKSAVGSLINPADKASKHLQTLGIDLKSIVSENSDNLPKLFQVFQKELSKLDSLQRAKVIEEIFGKYQFARISALLENIGQEGSQTQKVFDLMGASAAQTAKLADSELKKVTESASGRYQRALAAFQASIAPIGEKFVEFGTKALNVFSGIADLIQNNPILKNIATWAAAFVAVVGPIVMLGGVLGNFIGYLLKGFATFKNFKDGFRGFADLATAESVAAAKSGDLFKASLVNQTEAAKILERAIKDLNRELSQYQSYSGRGGGPFGPGGGGGRNPLYPSGYPKGPYSPKPTSIVTGPGGPKGDVIPAMLSAGEGILNAEAVRNLTPSQVEILNKDPKAAAAMNRLFGVYSRYNVNTPEGFNPYTYNSAKTNKNGEVVTPASVIEGSGGRQAQGAGFAPAFYDKSGGGGADIYHTTAFSEILRMAGYVAQPTVPGQKRRKNPLARRIEGYTPPSGTINAKMSIPSLIQQAAGDAQQNYYEPSPEDIKQLANAGIHIDPKLIKSAREEYITSLAGGNKKIEEEIRTQMSKMTEQDAKDWFGKGQVQSKATAAVLQEHLHSLISGPGGEKAAREFEKELQKATKSGRPADLQAFIDSKGLNEEINKRTKTLEDTFQKSVQSQLAAIPQSQRTPAALSKVLQTAAKQLDDDLDKGYIGRVKEFVNGQKVIGGRGLFKAVSGIARSATDADFSGTVRGATEDLKYSVKTLHNITGAEAKKVDKAIDTYARSVQAASTLPVGEQDAAIKTAASKLQTSLSKLGKVAVADIENINRMIASSTAQLAGVAAGSEAGVAARAAAGIARVPASPKTKRASGGNVSGPGGPKDDAIPAMLSNGEYVISAAAVKKYGTGMFDAINARKFADGGMVDSEGYATGGVVGYDSGGYVPAPLMLPEGKSYGPAPAVGSAGQRPIPNIPNIDFGPVLDQGPEYEQFLDDIAEKSKKFREENKKVSESLDHNTESQGKASSKLGKLKDNMKMGSMASIGLGMAISTAGAALGSMDNRAAKVGSTMAQFAGIGMAFGPWGAAIGAAVGGLKSLFDYADEIHRVNKNAIQSSFTESATAADFFGQSVNQLSDVNLTDFIDQAGKAGKSADDLAKSYSEAGDQVTKDFLDKIKNSDPEEVTRLLVNRYRTDLIQGLSDENAKIDVQALLQATGRTDIVFNVKLKIDDLNLTGPGDAFASQINDLNGQIQHYVDTAPGIHIPVGADNVSVGTPTGGGRAGNGAQTTAAGAEAINTKGILLGIQPTIENIGTAIMTAFSSMPVKDFNVAVQNTLGTYSDLEVKTASNAEAQLKANVAFKEYDSVVSKIRETMPNLANAMDEARAGGATYAGTITAAQLAEKGLIKTHEEFIQAANNPVYVRIIIEQDEYNKSVDKAAETARKNVGGQKPIPLPVTLEMVDDSAQQEKIREKWDKARTGAEKFYDNLDKKQDAVIEKNQNLIDSVNSEREARQKVYEVQQKNLDNAVKTVNLQNEIAKATAEGDLAKAAALKMELKGQEAKTAADARENKLQSREDAKIKAAEKNIKNANAEKKIISENRKIALESIAAREKAELKALAAATKAENIRRTAANKTNAANYAAAKSAREAGRTSKTIFGDIAKVLKEKLFTNPELAMKDSKIRALRDELIAAGYEPAKVDKELQKLFTSTSTSSKTFMTGVGDSIYSEVYTKGIERGLSPGQAKTLANNAVAAMKKVFENTHLSTSAKASLSLIAGDPGIQIGANGTIKIVGKVTPATAKILTKLSADGVITKNSDGSYSINAGIKAPNPVPVQIIPKLPTVKFSNGSWFYQVPAGQPFAGKWLPAATGGLIRGPGTKTSDSIPALLSNGEYVINASAAERLGVGFLDSINQNGRVPSFKVLDSKYNNKFSMGGPVMAKYAQGGAVNDSSVYNNYSINVNVEGTNASADDIANQVMNALKRRENMIGTRTRI